MRAAPNPRLEPVAEHLRLIEELKGDLARPRTHAEAFQVAHYKRALQSEAERLARWVKAAFLLLRKAITAHDDRARGLALIESVNGIGPKFIS